MNDSELAKTALEGAGLVKGSIAYFLQRRDARYARSEEYLCERIDSAGMISEDDYRVAAQYLVARTSRSKLDRIAKVIKKADARIAANNDGKSVSEETVPDDGWLDYFLDKVSFVSDDDVQDIWAAILANECKGERSVRKVMLDRLALLDRESAKAFGALCSLSVSVEVSTGEVYVIPFYLRDDDLFKMANKHSKPSADEVNAYRALLPGESELMLLQDIGLISVAYDNDECVVFTGKPADFHVEVKERRVWSGKTYSDNNEDSHYVPTGAVRFMSTGLCVYEAIASSMDDRTKLLTSIVQGYYAAIDPDGQ